MDSPITAGSAPGSEALVGRRPCRDSRQACYSRPRCL